jgi:uncharacterized protein (TIGR00106 family)
MSLMTFFTMTPLGKGESVSKHVVKTVGAVQNSGIPYVITPMGTIIEGETWDETMSVLKRGFNIMKRECSRISIVIKIDYRKGKKVRMGAKIDALENKLGKKLRRID